MPLEPGQTLSHYRIERQIGEGGMGAVFLAEDTKLGRKVALKVLPAAMASDEDRLARFQREAKPVAALSHPNIVTLYSVEEEDGVHFITMEFVEGQTTRGDAVVVRCCRGGEGSRTCGSGLIGLATATRFLAGFAHSGARQQAACGGRVPREIAIKWAPSPSPGNT